MSSTTSNCGRTCAGYCLGENLMVNEERIVIEFHLKGMSLETATKLFENILGEIMYVYPAVEVVASGVAKETEEENG